MEEMVIPYYSSYMENVHCNNGIKCDIIIKVTKNSDGYIHRVNGVIEKMFDKKDEQL